MVVLRDDERIARLKKWGQRASLIGMLFLIGGLFVIFVNPPNPFLLQTLALIVGFLLSQVGIYLTQRYARSPRPDEVLDEAVKKVARDGRMYHYLLPAPHVLLTQAGPIVFVLKYQTGKISAEGDDWRQTGMGFLGFRRIFGQEGLGNPTKEAENYIAALAKYIHENAPSIDEVPIGAMIVFTAKNLDTLDVEGSRIPAMHFSKVKGYLRQQGLGESLPRGDYEALQAAFDEAAGDLVAEEA